MRRSSFFAVLVLAGCGNTPITVGGTTLEPRNAVFLQFEGDPKVVLTDVPDYCASVKRTVTLRTCGATSPNPYFAFDGNYLSFDLYGPSSGSTLRVDASNPLAFTSARFQTVRASGGSRQVQAQLGTIDIEQFERGTRLTGSYELSFEGGDFEQGQFSAQYCDAMQADVAAGPRCQAPECARYLSCLKAYGGDVETRQAYQTGGTCWTSTAEQAQSCATSCASFYERLVQGRTNLPAACR